MAYLNNEHEDQSLPLLSICIPAYNAQPCIKDCLDSLASQTFRGFEVIVVDDGSDEALELRECIHERIGAGSVRLERTSNRGTYAARQYAAVLAKGDYLFFVDADDGLINADVLAKLSEIIAVHGPDVILFNAVTEYNAPLVNYASRGWRGELDSKVFLREMVLTNRLNSLCCMVFRRELLVASEVGSKLCFAEDRLQKFEIIRRAQSVWVLDEPLYLYKEVPTSTTRSRYRPEYYLQACLVEERIYQYYDEIGVDWSKWAKGFMRITRGHLVSLARSTSIGRRARLRTYRMFRNQAACEKALECLDKSSIDMKHRLWVIPFEKRLFGLLDMVLMTRNLARRRFA